MAGRKKVCFVSDHNACRSIIAQACLLKLGFDHFDAQSFGIEPNRVHHLVYEVLEPKGFNLNFSFSKAFEVVENQKFDILVSMAPTVTGKIPQLPYDFELVEWNFEDPTVKDISDEDKKREIDGLAAAVEDEVKRFIEKYK